MPNTRVTHESLLVDRSVSRNIRATVVDLLVDRTLPRNSRTTGIYLLVDCILANEFGEPWSIVSDFTCEIATGDIERNNEDIWSIGTEYTCCVDYIREITDILNFTSLVGLEFSESYSTVWALSDLFYRWVNMPVDITQIWNLISSYAVSIQKLGLTQQLVLTEQWANPGLINKTQANTWALSDNFVVQSSDTRIRDTLVFTESWDLEDKIRALITNWTLSDSWSLTNLTDNWSLVDQFKLETEPLFVNDAWVLTSTFKVPYELVITDAWSLSDEYADADHHTSVSETWILAETWDVTPLSVGWSDYMHRAVWLGGLDTQVIFGLTSWISYVLESVRTFSDIINWHESWQLELPTETLTTNWSMSSEFTNEYYWGGLADSINFTETWFQVTSDRDVVNVFTPTSLYSSSVDTNRLIADNINLIGNFTAYSETISWAGCLTLPATILSLTDAIETVVLRNAEFGNTLTIDTTRGVGSSRGGTPYVNKETYWPAQDSYLYSISALTDEQCDQLLAFIERNIGTKISWRDHSGIRRFGYIQNPAVEMRRYSKRRASTELTLVEIPVESCTLDTLWTMNEAWLCL